MAEDTITEEEYARIGRKTVADMRKLVKKIKTLPDLPECKP